MLRGILILTGLSVLLGGWTTPTPPPLSASSIPMTMVAEFDHSGAQPVYRLNMRGAAFADGFLVFHAMTCTSAAPSTFQVPVSFDALGEASFSVNLGDLAAMCGGDLILGIELRDASEGVMPPPVAPQDMLVLEVHPLPVAQYGLFDPPYVASWTTSLPGSGGEHQAGICTYNAGLNQQTGIVDQYVFYTASWPLWFVTTGIEGLLPVN